ncbi:MAG: PIN domain-containing protein [candidate division NC10 bacterium]|nr:PIN domain-containing protein [candidate division NC10 bacterium]
MVRALFVLLCAALGLLGLTWHVGPPWGAVGGVGGGLAFGLLIVALERHLARLPGRRILQALGGLLAGLLGGYLVSIFLSRLLESLLPGAALLIETLCVAGGAYLGTRLTWEKGAEWSLVSLLRLLKEQPRAESYKLLDTSVIIDGRIADITETGFLEGTLVIPQFILRELQHIADSSDPLKRNRGRRGLDILQKIQKKVDIRVEISDMDFPEIREVDNKLVATAKALNAKIVTNDFNLNKVAELRGVGVLNINELTNALRPVVLPGEDMRVYVLKEGKEYNQGIAYLDDGTMVVVDSGRRHIGQTVDVCVTSVLQTTAGRMIFSRLKEEAEAA